MTCKTRVSTRSTLGPAKPGPTPLPKAWEVPEVIKQRLGVPLELASCHTTSISGFVIEGHTPVADIVRLLDERPRGVRGLAVPGMPMGSPGMDRADGRREAYNVMAFGTEGAPRVFTRYAAI